MTAVDMSLPGAEIVARALRDSGRGETSAETLALQVVGKRLKRLGIEVTGSVPEPEQALYARLRAESSADAYGRYNSLLRRLDSFASALERTRR